MNAILRSVATTAHSVSARATFSRVRASHLRALMVSPSRLASDSRLDSDSSPASVNLTVVTRLLPSGD